MDHLIRPKSAAVNTRRETTTYHTTLARGQMVFIDGIRLVTAVHREGKEVQLEEKQARPVKGASRIQLETP